ncbi:MAG: hypothetical protein IPL46_01760 [Saprospiraceae bacterium]|nr:hypothetical protein [Saprospiraceae bacterium]
MVTILNFLISIIFLYTIFSLLTSWFIEFYTRMVNKRGKYMWNKLKTLMDIKLKEGEKSLVASILGSPIIRSVSQHKKPEFIPKDLFAKAMVVEVAGDDYTTEVNYEKLKKIETKFAVSEDLKNLWAAMIDELKADGVNTHRQLEAKVAKWFEYYEDRLSVWYKNHIRFFLLIGGFILLQQQISTPFKLSRHYGQTKNWQKIWLYRVKSPPTDP